MTRRVLPPWAHVREGSFVILSAESAAWVAESTDVAVVFAARGRDIDRSLASEIAALLGLGTATSVAASSHGRAEDDRLEAEPSLEGLMTAAQAAERIGITDRAVRLAVAEGRLAATVVGGRRLIAEDDVDEFAQRRRTE